MFKINLIFSNKNPMDNPNLRAKHRIEQFS
jgi:hypothetical protein